MRQIAVAIQNENEKVDIKQTINSINNAGFKNVFVQWYDEKWDYGQEEQVQLCKKLGFNIIFAHLGYQNINSIWEEGKEGDKLIQRYQEDIKNCKQNGIPMVVMHLTSKKEAPMYSEIIMFILMMNLILSFLKIEYLQYIYMIMTNLMIYIYCHLMEQ